MCGICGLVNVENDRPVDFYEVRAMADLLWHRGPDDEGYHVERRVGLGHRRLSIIDLDTGRQPIYNESEDVCVVFNGEIYNFQELRDWLETRGHRFYTRTDTEVLVHLFEEKGTESFRLLHGMFAFALWDRNEQALYLVRDRLGIKPLYVLRQNGRLAFASEMKAFLGLSDFAPEIDLATLPHYLTWMFTPAESTLLRGVRKLLPGHYLVVRNGRVEERRYYALEDDLEGEGRRPGLAELRHTLAESVRKRLIADVPVGAFLSGGIDSSVVVGLMTRIAEGPVETFSVGFQEEQFSELPYARLVAQALGTRHHELVVTAGDVRENLERAVYHRDEPLAYPSEVPTLLLAELASQRVKVVLSGEGGDELFAGYPKYVAERLAGWLRLVPSGLRRAFLESAAERLPFGARRLRILLANLARGDEAERWTSWFAAFDGRQRAALLSPAVLAETRADTVDLSRAILDRARGRSALDRHLFLDMHLWLPDNLLQKGDKMTMAASLEARVPLLDQDLVRLAFQMPGSLKVRGKTGKVALRRIAAEILPPEIQNRRKVGFTLPIGLWFRGEWADWVRETLTSQRALQRGLFRPEMVRRLVEEHQRGVVDRQRELWVLLNLEVWQKVFVDRTASRAGRAEATLAKRVLREGGVPQ